MTVPTQADALLASGLILPILDGLDEIPEQVRGPAISRINNALRPIEHVVVTCRTEQYREAVRPETGTEVTLRAAAAVQLRPLDADTVRRYLCDDAPGPIARARWNPILAVLGTEAPAGKALRTPLMVGLARAIYNPLPGELAGTLRDPAELCSPALQDRTAVEALLFDAFIPSTYRHDPGGRWKAQDAEKWIVFLARHLERRIGNPDLAWWQLSRAMPSTAAWVVGAGVWFGVLAVVGAVVGVVAGVAVGVTVVAEALVGALFVHRFWPMLGARAAAPTKIPGGSRLEAPARDMRISVRWSRIAVAVVAGVAVGYGVGFRFGVWVGALVGAAVAVVGAAAVTVDGEPGDPAQSTSPHIIFVRDRRAALLLMLVGGVGFGVAVGVVEFGLGFGVVVAIGTGVGIALTFGLLLSASQAAWPSYLVTMAWLAFRHRLPWSLMGFLADAHKRGVLRQVGAVYQFRHIELQHRLANRDADSPVAAATEADG